MSGLASSCSLFFLCGPHTAGKTALIRELARSGAIDFAGAEIGKDLYYQRRLSTESQGSDFELEVTGLELARDQRLQRGTGTAVVETWHPGNLAYAAVRNPSAVPA